MGMKDQTQSPSPSAQYSQASPVSNADENRAIRSFGRFRHCLVEEPHPSFGFECFFWLIHLESPAVRWHKSHHRTVQHGSWHRRSRLHRYRGIRRGSGHPQIRLIELQPSIEMMRWTLHDECHDHQWSVLSRVLLRDPCRWSGRCPD
jgi:hypothetical protein